MSLQEFDINSSYTPVLCRSRICDQSSFSGPAVPNLKSAGSCDEITLSITSMLSIPSVEVLKEGFRFEGLDLKTEEMVESRRLGAGVASGSGTGSRPI